MKIDYIKNNQNMKTKNNNNIKILNFLSVYLQSVIIWLRWKWKKKNTRFREIKYMLNVDRRKYRNTNIAVL
jgi:hypothetical protein